MLWRAQATWKLNNIAVSPETQEVSIEASAQGLTAFFLSLMGMPTTATLSASHAGVHLVTSHFSGATRTFCPRQHIAITVFVESKPVELLVLGFLFLPLWGLGILFWIWYFFAKRRVIVGVGTAASTVESLKLKASTQQRSQLENAADVLESLLQHAAPIAGGGQAPAPTHRAPPAMPPSRTGQIIACQHCGKQLSVPNATPGQRFRCPGCQEITRV